MADTAPQVTLAPTAVPSNTPTPSPTSTNTPLPTPTATLVVRNGQDVSPAADDGQPSLPTAEPTLDPAQAGATPTNTLVVPRGGQETPVPESNGSNATQQPAEMPPGGGVVTENNNYLAWVGIGLLFVLLAGIVSRLGLSPWTFR